MSEKFIFQLQDIHKSYGDKEVLSGITLAFLEGAKIGLIGNNGAGKTTLLNIIGEADTEFDGMAKIADGKTCGYVAQEPMLDPAKNVWENILAGVAELQAIVDEYNDLTMKLGELEGAEAEKAYERFSVLQDEMDGKNLWDLDRTIEMAMHALGAPPKDADVTKLSGGEKRRVALCRTLLQKPDLLLLDEPTNHLDADAVAWLERHLSEFEGTVILITHDRYFLDNVVGWMLEIDRGKAFPYKGNYSSYLEQKSQRLDSEKRRDAARKKVLDKELKWIRQTPKARQAKSKARVREFQRLLDQHQEAKAAQGDEGRIEIPIPPGPRLGDRVISFTGVNKAFGDKVLIKDLTFDLPPGGIVGVIGPNGTGKTTLMKMIIGRETADSGTIELGKTVHACYVDQGREALDDSKTVFEEITGGMDQIPYGDGWIDARAYCGRFRFRGGDQQKRVGELSGGQRNRCQMAKLLRHGGNVLLLDEPTNDLDLQTLRVLEEALEEFPGSAVVVTHDRYFLNRVATHILAFEGDGHVHFFEGDYDTYVDWKKARREELGLGEESRAHIHRKF
ncbi:MAG: energy-dependent translational throttle protein EttA [Planctomycetota bacterium]